MWVPVAVWQPCKLLYTCYLLTYLPFLWETLKPWKWHTHTHTHLFNGPLSGTTRWAGTRKVKPIWILLKQETVSGSGIRWAICKFAPRSSHITTPVPRHSVFTGRMPFLPPNQQRQSTEGTLSGKETSFLSINKVNCTLIVHIVSLLTSSQKLFRMFSICMQSFSPLVDCCVKNVQPQTMSDVN